VTFKDKVKVPRFPEPNMAEPRDSPANKAAVQRAISSLERVRAPTYDARAKELAAKHAAKEKARFWLIDAMVLELPLSAVSDVAARGDVQYVEHVTSDAPPPQNHTIFDGSSLIGANFYSGFALGGGFFGLLDTGIRTSHTLLSGRYDNLRDCYGGTTDCSGGNPNDVCNHGTSTASVLSGNSSLGDANGGVTNYITVDSWKTTKDSDCRTDTNAVVKAFQNAVASYDKFIVAEVQMPNKPGFESDVIAISTAADAAFDSGSIVIAAAGNFGKDGAGSVTAPGSAHKVLAVGAVDIGNSRFMMDYSGHGPTSDGRVKPDFTAPTNVDAASGDSDTELRLFTGTSCATPFGAAAAALAYNFLRGSWWAIDPGQVYAYMILSGNNRNFDNDRGAGLLSMPVIEGTMPYGTLSNGMVTVTNYQSVDITILCSSPGSVQAAIWWPETTTTHNDVDLYLLQPDGTLADVSLKADSVFEKVKTTSSPPSGVWTFQVNGFSVTGTQDVYFAALCL
jgi:serine protease AprX